MSVGGARGPPEAGAQRRAVRVSAYLAGAVAATGALCVLLPSVAPSVLWSGTLPQLRAGAQGLSLSPGRLSTGARPHLRPSLVDLPGAEAAHGWEGDHPPGWPLQSSGALPGPSSSTAAPPPLLWLVATAAVGLAAAAQGIAGWGRRLRGAGAPLAAVLRCQGAGEPLAARWAVEVAAEESYAMATVSGEAQPGEPAGPQPPSPATPTGDSKDASAGEMVRFALPALGIVLVNPLMTVIDNAFVGRASSIQVAAMGPATVLLDFPVYVFYFLSVATTNLISMRIAQQVPPADAARQVLSITMRLGVVVGLALLGFVVCAKLQVLNLVHASAEVILHALRYVAVRKWWLPFSYLVTTTQASLMATKDSLSPLKAVAVSGLVNACGDFVCCQLLGMGLVGAGLATLVAQFVLLAMLLGTARRKGFLPAAADLRRAPSWAELAPVLAFAPPLILSVGLRLGGYTILTSGAASLGTLPLAAHQILVGLYLFVALVSDVLNLTTQTMLPKFLTGASKSAEKARVLVVRMSGLALTLGAATGLLMVLLTTRGAGLFTRDAFVAAKMATAAAPIAVSLLANPVAIVFEAVLICTKRFKTTMASSLLSTTLLYFTMTNLVGVVGLAGVWWALAGSFMTRALIAGVRIFASRLLAGDDADPQPVAAAA